MTVGYHGRRVGTKVQREKVQKVIITKDPLGYLVTYQTKTARGTWRQGVPDRFKTYTEVIPHIRKHERTLRNLGIRMELEDNAE